MAVIDSRSADVLLPLESMGGGNPISLIRQYVSLCTGLGMKFVREAYIAAPGVQPSPETDWCAVNIDRIEFLGTPYQQGVRGDLAKPESGYAETIQHQILHCAASFYGPDAMETASVFRDSFSLGHNLSWLKRKGLSGISIDETFQRLPDMFGNRWIDRYQLGFRLGRAVTRKYGIRDIAGFSGVETYTEKGKI